MASISRNSAFISGTVRLRLARTEPWQAIVDSNSSRRAVSTCELPYSRISCSTARASAAGSASDSGAGTPRTASVAGPSAEMEKPSASSAAALSSTVATSSASAAKVAGTSSGWTGMRTPEAAFRRS